MQQTILHDADALLRQSDILPRLDKKSGKRTAGLVPVSPTTLWRWVKAGKFPKPRKLGENVVAWRAADIAAWLAAREVA
jgi:prophage regulatory protein